jgi:hypothetical protein
MHLLSARSTSFVLLAVLIALTAGCSSLARIHPPGDRVGSCEGRLRLRSSGEQVSFRLDLYSQNNNLRLYLSVPGKYRYRPVEDIDLEDGGIGIELSSPRTRVEGELAGSGLKFSGKFRGLSGVLELGFGR